MVVHSKPETQPRSTPEFAAEGASSTTNGMPDRGRVCHGVRLLYFSWARRDNLGVNGLWPIGCCFHRWAETKAAPSSFPPFIQNSRPFVNIEPEGVPFFLLPRIHLTPLPTLYLRPRRHLSVSFWSADFSHIVAHFHSHYITMSLFGGANCTAPAPLTTPSNAGVAGIGVSCPSDATAIPKSLDD